MDGLRYLGFVDHLYVPLIIAVLVLVSVAELHKCQGLHANGGKDDPGILVGAPGFLPVGVTA